MSAKTIFVPFQFTSRRFEMALTVLSASLAGDDP